MAKGPILSRRKGLAVVAICMGMQAMNVATGGTLVQDIPSEVYGVKTYEGVLRQDKDKWHRSPYHKLYPGKGMWPGVFHGVKLTGGEDIWGAMGEKKGARVEVMSIHHQAVEKVGKGLSVIARSADGKVVEAVRHVRFPRVLGVQFHPEYDVIWDEAREARLKADGKRNYFAAKLREKAETLRFHKAFWRVFGEWIGGEKGVEGSEKGKRGVSGKKGEKGEKGAEKGAER